MVQFANFNFICPKFPDSPWPCLFAYVYVAELSRKSPALQKFEYFTQFDVSMRENLTSCDSHLQRRFKLKVDRLGGIDFNGSICKF